MPVRGLKASVCIATQKKRPYLKHKSGWRETAWQRECVLELGVRAKWIRCVYQRTLWHDKLQQGWTRCPAVVLLWLTQKHPHLCMHKIQICVWKKCASANRYAKGKKEEREPVIMQDHIHNNNTIDTQVSRILTFLIRSLQHAQLPFGTQHRAALGKVFTRKLKWDISWAKWKPETLLLSDQMIKEACRALLRKCWFT